MSCVDRMCDRTVRTTGRLEAVVEEWAATKLTLKMSHRAIEYKFTLIILSSSSLAAAVAAIIAQMFP